MLTWSPPRLRQLFVIALFVSLASLVYLYSHTTLHRLAFTNFTPSSSAPKKDHRNIFPHLKIAAEEIAQHPISTLIADAQELQQRALSQRSHDLQSAAERYRARRGRHPPPGFDAWFDYARQHDAFIIESFFDRIYDDILPFWSIEPRDLQRQSHPRQWNQIITVREGQVYSQDHDNDPMDWVGHWRRLIEEIAAHLPDVNIPLNVRDESRVIVPWQEMKEMVKTENRDRGMMKPGLVVDRFSGLEQEQDFLDEHEGLVDWQWHTENSNAVWDLVVQGCSPDSPAADTHPIGMIHEPPMMSTAWPLHSFQGFVANWSLATDPCQHPQLRSLHGSFIEPISLSISQNLMPLFGGSKLPMNNEILLPAAIYLSDDRDYSSESVGPAWQEKDVSLVWRGVASGGRNKAESWTHFQRHRFLQMTNATAVAMVAANDLELGMNATFVLPDQDQYPLLTASSMHEPFSEWLAEIPLDTGFVHLRCFPDTPDPEAHKCWYTDQCFTTVPGMSMADQFRSAFVPDIDGNSFSGRFRAFLQSTSLPIKASVYTEWHDSRLTPWVHFVPMDNSFVDLYGILDYFIASETLSLRQNMTVEGAVRQRSAGEIIASDGKTWAEQVLRREDMAIYTWRLLLEWARVCDTQRDFLGWVGDLT